jgi:hypothetical protein
MKTYCLFNILATLGLSVASAASAQNMVAPAPADKGAATVYRQVMPDGRIVYSDHVIKGAKIDHTITVEPLIKGNSWTTESSKKPAIAPQTDRTAIGKAPASGKKKTLDEASSDVIRAEMFLEDAKKRQEAGIEPLPGERTGTVSGKSRLNEEYQARQKLLARDVAYAEATLKKAIADRNDVR